VDPFGTGARHGSALLGDVRGHALDLGRCLEPVMSQNPAEFVRWAVHDDSRRSAVVIEDSTKTLASSNPTHTLRRRRTVDEFIPEPLVIALAMIVLHELGEGSGARRMGSLD
jgi:hypothetical protein